MKKDIESAADIELMVNSFYNVVKSNSILGHIFKDVAKVDWQTHLPKMYSFWSSLLLGEHSYSGNPMVKHIALSKITPLTETEFSTWLLLFNRTVDLHFQGAKAEEAKSRAANIARLMLHKIEMH
jgi:hemoglobin